MRRARPVRRPRAAARLRARCSRPGSRERGSRGWCRARRGRRRDLAAGDPSRPARVIACSYSLSASRFALGGAGCVPQHVCAQRLWARACRRFGAGDRAQPRAGDDRGGWRPRRRGGRLGRWRMGPARLARSRSRAAEKTNVRGTPMPFVVDSRVSRSTTTCRALRLRDLGPECPIGRPRLSATASVSPAGCISEPYCDAGPRASVTRSRRRIRSDARCPGRDCCGSRREEFDDLLQLKSSESVWDDAFR